MKLNFIKNIIVVATVFSLVFSPVFSSLASAEVMSSGNYGLQSDSLNFGGGNSSSGSYGLESTVGEVGTGDLSGTSYNAFAGYQQSSSTTVAVTPTTPTTDTDGSSSGSRPYPINPINFVATPKTNSINLSWQYSGSTADTFRVVRSDTFFPNDISDGEVIFEGDALEIIDYNVNVGTRYYYALFAKDIYGRYSSGVLAQARITPAGEIEKPVTAEDIFKNVPDATNIHESFSKLTLLDFDFIQGGVEIEHVDNVVSINGKEELTISLDYHKVPEILKTIAVTLTDPDDASKFFTFLLRVNKNKTAYEATIGALGKSGNYKINVTILDYKNQGLKRITGDLKAFVFGGVKGLLNNYGVNININFIIIILLIIIAIIVAFVLSRRYKKVFAAFIIFAFIFSNFAFYTSSAHAAINKQINYQGKLVDSSGDLVTDGTYAMEFKLYTVSSGGSAIYTETLSGVNEVQVTNGLFSVMLGAVSSLSSVDFNQTLYLGVNVESDGEMTPRKIIGAVPSAFVAEVADTLDGLDSTQFLRSDIGSVTSGYFVSTTTNATSTFAGGIDLSDGCFAIDGVCLSAGGSSYTNADANAYIHASSTIPKTYTANTFTALQTFNYASTTAITSTGSAYFATTEGGLLIGTTTATSTSKLTLAGGNFLHTAVGNPTLKGTYDTFLASGVYVSGKYAYIADYSSGLNIIDVSNPSSPLSVGTYDTTGYSYAVQVSGKYAYVADEVSGLQIIDVSNPTSPSLVGTYDTTFAGDVYVSGKYAYVADGGAGLQIIDVSNPSSPSLAGTYNTSGSAIGVYVSGKYAYVADDTSGIHIIDISNSSAPSLMGTYNTTGNATDVYVSGKYAYVSDGASGIHIINISNPSSPSLVSTYNTPHYAAGLYVSGKYVYLGDSSTGLQVIDVSNPSSPSLVGTYDSSGTAFAVHVSGKYAYLADYLDGLKIIDINGIETPSLYAGNIETNVLNAIENIIAGGDIYAQGGLNVGISGIFSRGTISAFIASTTQTNPVVANFMGGNVGIGTTSPYAKLSVVGPVVAEYFNATSTTATSTFLGGVAIGGPFRGQVSPYTKVEFSDPTNGYLSDWSFDLAGHGSGAINFGSSGGTYASRSVRILSPVSPIGTYLVHALGNMAGRTWDGTAFKESSAISLEYDAAIGANDTPGAISFYTSADGTATPRNRMMIRSSGNVGIGTTSPYAILTTWGTTTGKIFEAVTSASTTALSISATGFATTTVSGLTIAGSATSTSNVGFNLSGGCFAVNGTCLGGSSYGDTDVNAYIHASTTIPKTYTANTFTALQTFNYASTTAISASATIKAGTSTVSNSVDSVISIMRSVDNSVTGNGHAFSDSSQVNRTGTIGYNSFDARINIVGTQNYDHYAAFQALPSYDSSGTMTNYYGLFSGLNKTAGTITNAHGVYVDAITGGTNNYGIYVEDNNSVFRDDSASEGIPLTVTNNNGGDSSSATLAFNNASTNAVTGKISSFRVGSGNYAMTFQNFGATGLFEAMRINNSGNVGIGTTSPYAKLSVVGPVVAQYFHATSTTATSTIGGSLVVGGPRVFSGYSVTGGLGNIAAGDAQAGTAINASGQGAFAYGQTTSSLGGSSLILSSGQGSLAGGMTTGVFGSATTTSSGVGSVAWGYAVAAGPGTSANLTSSGTGSIVLGAASNKNLTSSAIGSFAGGYASAGNILSSADGAFAFGDNITASAALSTAFGSGFTNSTANSFMVGYGSTPTLTVNATNVGIGTTSPYAKLSVVGQAVAAYFTATTSTASTFPYASTTAITSTGSAYFGTSSGGVLIGTTTANSTSKLTLAGGNFIHTAVGDPTLKGTYNTSGTSGGVYVSGKYAYVADSTSLQIIDISNPGSPTSVGSYSSSGSLSSVFVSGKYAYVTVSSLSGSFLIIDVSNPALPTLVGTANAGSDVNYSYVSGKYAYVSDAFNGLKIFDISDPRSPLLLSTYPSVAESIGVYVSGKYAYVADADSGLQVIDISNPVSPSLMGTYNTSGYANGVYVSGKYAYVADGSSGLQIVNISNPSSPALVGTYNTTGTAYDVYVSGRYAYVADDTSGVHVIDVLNPASPSLVGTYNTSGNAAGIYVSGKYAYVADGSSGLQILDINGIETPSLYAGNIETNVLNATENIIAGGDIYAQGGLNVGISGIFSRGTISAFIASTTQTNPVVATFMGGNVGIGTTSPYARLSVVGEIVGSYFTATTTATSTFGGSIAVTEVNATSTFAGGIDLSDGCFAIDGVCLSAGGSYGDTDVNAYIHASTTIPKTYTANTFSALQTFSYASTTAITSTGSAYFATTDGGLLIGTTTANSTSKLTLAGGNFLHTAVGNPTSKGSLDTAGTSYDLKVIGKYAYVADGTSGLQIIDVSNTASPTLVGTYNTTGTAYGTYVSGKYAYVADTISGLHIIDISNPALPSLVGTYNTPGTAYRVYVSGKYAYVADDTSGLQIIDISNPASPTLVGTYNTTGTAYGVYVSGKYAYIADDDAGLVIIDISNPASPSLVGTYNTSGNASGLYVSGRYAYLADTVDGLRIIDISNSSAPSLVGTYNTSGSAIDIYVSGKYAYVADDTSGVHVVDISNPASPSLVGTYDTSGSAFGLYVSGKYAYVADFTSGLQILDINGIETPSLYAGNIETNVLNATENIIAGGDIYAQGGLNVGISGIFSRGTISAFIASTTQTNPVVANFMGGNVGIGTTSPYAKLSVVGPVVAEYFHATSTTATSTIAGGLDVNGGGLLYDFNTGITSIGAIETGAFNFDTDAGQVNWVNLPVTSSAVSGLVQSYTASIADISLLTLYAEATGVDNTVRKTAVGIGSTTPMALLTIQNNAFTASSTYDFFIASTTANFATTTHFAITNTGNVGVGTSTPWATFAINPTAGYASNQFVIGSSTATSFLVNNSGNVGIGTTTPSAKLSVTGSGTGSGRAFAISDSSNVDKFVVKDSGNAVLSGGLQVIDLTATELVLAPFLGLSGANGGVGMLPNIAVEGSESLDFQVNDYSRLFINTSGNVGISTTSPWKTLSVTGTVAIDGLTAAGASGDALCLGAGKEVQVNTGAQTCTVSSARFKNNIANLDIGLEALNKLNPVSFIYNGSTENRIGFIAEEVGAVDKRLIFTEADGVTPRGVRYEDMVAVLAKAIKEQQVQINAFQSATSTNTHSTSTIIVNNNTNSSNSSSNLSDEAIATITSNASAAALSGVADLFASSTILNNLASSTGVLVAGNVADTLASSTPSFISRIASAVIESLKSSTEWVFAKITATLAIFDRVETKTLCIGETCVNEDQLKALLAKIPEVASTTEAVVEEPKVEEAKVEVISVKDATTATSTETIKVEENATSTVATESPSIKVEVETPVANIEADTVKIEEEKKTEEVKEIVEEKTEEKVEEKVEEEKKEVVEEKVEEKKEEVSEPEESKPAEEKTE